MNSTKEKLHRIIFGVDTLPGRIFDIVLLILILASITILMLDSVQELNAKWGTTFKILIGLSPGYSRLNTLFASGLLKKEARTSLVLSD